MLLIFYHVNILLIRTSKETAATLRWHWASPGQGADGHGVKQDQS